LGEVKALVLDTSAFIVGFDAATEKILAYSIPEVANELSLSKMARTRFEVALESANLSIKIPTEESYHRISGESNSMGEKISLSETDIKILALALDLRNEGKDPLIVTDDYAIQNMAEKLHFSYEPLATFGISYEFKWIIYCPACFRRFPQSYSKDECGVCGTRVSRKVLRKQNAKRKGGKKVAVS
jgi:UPF0271 protein